MQLLPQALPLLQTLQQLATPLAVKLGDMQSIEDGPIAMIAAAKTRENSFMEQPP